jgi:hypothetical protein
MKVNNNVSSHTFHGKIRSPAKPKMRAVRHNSTLHMGVTLQGKHFHSFARCTVPLVAFCPVKPLILTCIGTKEMGPGSEIPSSGLTGHHKESGGLLDLSGSSKLTRSTVVGHARPHP